MKICISCNEIKDTSCFGKDKKNKDGLSRKCKECKNKYNRENYRKIICYYKKRDADYMITRKKEREAVQKVKRAIKTGAIIKPSECSKCGRTNCVIDGHHDDYDKPLEVIWLCRSCHILHHQKLEQSANS